MRNRGAVVASTVAEVVNSLGGWIFDRTTAGCETIVLTADPGDTRALEILGAKASARVDVPADAEWADDLDVLAAATDIYLADARVREIFRVRRERTAQQSYLWGRGPDIEIGAGFAVVTPHRVSLAGQAFKRAALDAVGIAHHGQPVAEVLWTAHGQH